MRERPGMYKTWGEAARELTRIAVISALVLVGILWPMMCLGQEPGDTVIVEVRFEPIGRTMVIGIIGQDSIPLLPTREIWELAGAGEPPAPRMHLDAITRELGITSTWWPRRLLVDLHDYNAATSAMRRHLRERREGGRARGAMSISERRGGPFGEVVADHTGEYVTEFGYSFAGRLSARVRYASANEATRWALNANPVGRLWLGYAGSHTDQRGVTTDLSARLSYQRMFLSMGYRLDDQHEDLTAAGAVTIDDFALFASGASEQALERAVLTWQGNPVGVQVGVDLTNIDPMFTTRLRWGAGPLSTFTIPTAR